MGWLERLVSIEQWQGGFLLSSGECMAGFNVLSGHGSQ